MNEDFEKVYHQLEKEHFWFKSRRNYILQELKNANRNSKILDIGCSSGVLLDELVQNGFNLNNLYGIDISERAICDCRKEGFENTFVMDAQSIDLDNTFDFIIASDCLEHLENDEKALNNWYNLLKPNGVAYIFVPAFMSLWSEHDEVNMHFRRYSKSELKQKVNRNGFKIIKSSYWNISLFIPILLSRFLNRFKAKDGRNIGDLKRLPLFNSLCFILLNFENKLLKHINFPFGVSAYCIARKSSTNK